MPLSLPLIGLSLTTAALAAAIGGQAWRLRRLRRENQSLRAEVQRQTAGRSFARIGTWDWRVGTDTLHWSDEVFPLFGFRPGEVTPSYGLFWSMLHPEDAERVRAAEVRCETGSAGHDAEYRVIWRDGTIHWLRETGNLLPATDGEPRHMIGMVRDITAEKDREAQVFHQLYNDGLTGVHSRQYFRVRLDDALRRADRRRTLVGLAFVDVDGFKALNHRHGRAAGDTVLSAIGQRLRDGVRATDCVARLGGDKFVVMVEDLTDAASLERLASSLMPVLRTPVSAHDAAGTPVMITPGASVGLGLYPAMAQSATDLMDIADQAMYRAKGEGSGISYPSLPSRP